MKTMRAGLAAVAAAVLFCCQSGTATQAQTPDKPQAQAKPTAAPAKPKPQPKPAAQKQTSAPEVAGRKSVCVASALGHVFDVKKIGLMVFGNSLDHVPVDSWGIDDAAVRAVTQTIGKDFNVRGIAIPKAALTEFETPRVDFFRNEYNDLIRATAAASAKCDIYVMLTRSASNYNGTNQYIAGLGILDSSPLLPRLFVFASYTVRIYDGDNLTALKTVTPTTDSFPSIMAMPRTMYRQVERTWWPTPAQAAVQNAQLKNVTRALVEEGLAKTLPQIFEGS